MRWLLATAAALLLTACGSDSKRAPAATPAPTVEAAATVTATPAKVERKRYQYARLRRATPLLRAPGGAKVTDVGLKTEFGTPTLLNVVRERGGWLKVAHPALPNHEFGWIRASAAQLYGTDYDIVVSRAKRLAKLRVDGKVVYRFTVGIGRAGNETPLGRYAVTDKLRTTDPTSPYGCCAVALTGRQPKLVEGWPGGDRLAIHGTPAAGTIGQAASLGCLRASKQALTTLFRRMPIGAPVFIRGR